MGNPLRLIRGAPAATYKISGILAIWPGSDKHFFAVLLAHFRSRQALIFSGVILLGFAVSGRTLANVRV
jgi:hypothetical protein